MRIKREYQIDRVTSADFDIHPVLGHFNVERIDEQAIAVACNGWTLVVVPVDLQDSDVPGLVHASTLKLARSESPRKTTGILDISLDENDASTPSLDAWRTIKVSRKSNGILNTSYPSWRHIVARRPRQSQSIAVNTDRLLEVCAGLGTKHVILTIQSDTHAIIVESRDNPGFYDQSEQLVAPYGVVMPMSLPGKAKRKPPEVPTTSYREPVAEIDVSWPEE